MPASVAQLDAPSDWRPGDRGLDPRRGRQHSFMESDHEIFSTVILSLPLIQEGQLSVSGERMCTILVNCLEDYACPVNVWLGKLTALDRTPLSWLGRKTSTNTNSLLYKSGVKGIKIITGVFSWCFRILRVNRIIQGQFIFQILWIMIFALIFTSLCWFSRLQFGERFSYFSLENGI